ncbi:hypothetical protein [Streptomyces sp. NPDC058751]|uniref:hypothetical protein n=1 Tax=Streptomyces sp. NPDC058751 TaxID=3346623 RepID=UPI0036CBAB0C
MNSKRLKRSLAGVTAAGASVLFGSPPARAGDCIGNVTKAVREEHPYVSLVMAKRYVDELPG